MSGWEFLFFGWLFYYIFFVPTCWALYKYVFCLYWSMWCSCVGMLSANTDQVHLPLYLLTTHDNCGLYTGPRHALNDHILNILAHDSLCLEVIFSICGIQHNMELFQNIELWENIRCMVLVLFAVYLHRSRLYGWLKTCDI